MNHSTDARTIWREAWRNARRGKLAAKPLLDTLETLPGLGRFDACRLHWIITRAQAPAWPAREYVWRQVLNCFGNHNPFSAPAMGSPRFDAWRHTVARTEALVQRLEAAGRIERGAGGYVERVLPRPTVAKRCRSAKARATMANAGAILRAARRTHGAYSWGPSLCLTAPNRNAFGWLAFTWHDGERQCTVDLSRHRSIAKRAALDAIANRTEPARLAA